MGSLMRLSRRRNDRWGNGLDGRSFFIQQLNELECTRYRVVILYLVQSLVDKHV